MTRYEIGSVLLMDFPVPSRKGTKRRPVLLLADVDPEDVVVAQITSHGPRGRHDVPLGRGKASGLLFPSCARVDKLATLPRGEVRRVLGAVSREEWTQVLAALRHLFRV